MELELLGKAESETAASDSREHIFLVAIPECNGVDGGGGMSGALAGGAFFATLFALGTKSEGILAKAGASGHRLAYGMCLAFFG